MQKAEDMVIMFARKYANLRQMWLATPEGSEEGKALHAAMRVAQSTLLHWAEKLATQDAAQEARDTGAGGK